MKYLDRDKLDQAFEELAKKDELYINHARNLMDAYAFAIYLEYLANKSRIA